MPINGTIVNAPVSIYDIQSILGLTEGGFIDRLILKAAYGGRWNETYQIQQAFHTNEYFNEGTSSIGFLIPKTEPYFNIFSEISPVEWVNFNGELRPKLRTADWLKPSTNNTDYGYNILDFDGYNHLALKANLDMPAILTTSYTTITRDIVYTFPRWLSLKLPTIAGRSCWVLTRTPPDSANYNSNFVAVIPDAEIADYGLFKATINGMPEYKDETIILDLYVSIWIYHGNINPQLDLNYQNYTFAYKIMDIGKAYHTQTTVTGTNNRPSPTIPITIDMDINSAGSYGSAYYIRINSSRIRIVITDLQLINNCDLIPIDLGYRLFSIERGYYDIFEREVTFPSENYSRFKLIAN